MISMLTATWYISVAWSKDMRLYVGYSDETPVYPSLQIHEIGSLSRRYGMKVWHLIWKIKTEYGTKTRAVSLWKTGWLLFYRVVQDDRKRVLNCVILSLKYGKYRWTIKSRKVDLQDEKVDIGDIKVDIEISI